MAQPNNNNNQKKRRLLSADDGGGDRDRVKDLIRRYCTSLERENWPRVQALAAEHAVHISPEQQRNKRGVCMALATHFTLAALAADAVAVPEIDAAFIDPVSMAPLSNPRTTPDGHTYNASTLASLVPVAAGVRNDPMTRRPFRLDQVVPARLVRQLLWRHFEEFGNGPDAADELEEWSADQQPAAAAAVVNVVDETDDFLQAIDENNPGEVMRLLNRGRVNPAARDNWALLWASQNGHAAVVERLLQDARVNPAAQDNRTMIFASHEGHLAVVNRLLEDQRVDPASFDNAALRYASMNGHLAVVERLLQDRRVDPATLDNWALRYASQNGHVAVVERLLRYHLQHGHASAIEWARQNGHAALVDQLQQQQR